MDLFAIPYPIRKMKYEYPRDSEGLAKAYRDKCQEGFVKSRQTAFPPAFVVFTEDTEHHLDARDFVNDGVGKDFLVSMAKAIAKKYHAIASVFVSEIWYARATAEDREKMSRGEELRASMHPNKVECFMAVGEYSGMQPVMALSTPVRDTSGLVTSFKPFIIPPEMRGQSRFFNILEPDLSRG